MLLGTAMAGTEGSVMGFLILDRQRPSSSFLGPPVFRSGGPGWSVQGDQKLFWRKPGLPWWARGSNGSDEDNYIEGDGWDNYFQFRFHYVLPIGHGKNQIVNTYVLDRRLVSSGEAGEDILGSSTKVNPCSCPAFAPRSSREHTCTCRLLSGIWLCFEIGFWNMGRTLPERCIVKGYQLKAGHFP